LNPFGNTFENTLGKTLGNTPGNFEGSEIPNFPYYNTVDQIYHAEWSMAKLARLELLRRSIHALWPNGHPTRLVHVAGTSGKGSTSRLLEVALGAAGHSASYLGPHLFDYRERFSIDGEFVGQAEIHQLWQQRIQPYCVQMTVDNPHHLFTFHEVSILMALALFERHEVKWAAIETGIGGRYDLTRGLEVAATVLTNVGSDHPHMLGATLWQRVLDKAGIARPGVPFFTTERHPESLEIIRAVCQDVGAPLTMVDEEAVEEFRTKLFSPGNSPLPEQALLTAAHQQWNGALALATTNHLCPMVDDAVILERLSRAHLLGRFWRVDEGIYADIAHNVEKIRVLVAEVQTKFPDREKIFVVGISGQRVASEVFAALAGVAKAIIVTAAAYRGQDPNVVRASIEQLAGEIPTRAVADPREALQVAKQMRDEQELIVLTGSTYMIEQMLNPDPYLRHLHATYGWRNRESSGGPAI
jgi:dihydrofolate synthase/folylpolyglutamate synthase